MWWLLGVVGDLIWSLLVIKTARMVDPVASSKKLREIGALMANQQTSDRFGDGVQRVWAAMSMMGLAVAAIILSIAAVIFVTRQPAAPVDSPYWVPNPAYHPTRFPREEPWIVNPNHTIPPNYPPHPHPHQPRPRPSSLGQYTGSAGAAGEVNIEALEDDSAAEEAAATSPSAAQEDHHDGHDHE